MGDRLVSSGLLRRVEVLPLASSVMASYDDARAALESQGQLMGSTGFADCRARAGDGCGSGEQ